MEKMNAVIRVLRRSENLISSAVIPLINTREMIILVEDSDFGDLLIFDFFMLFVWISVSILFSKPNILSGVSYGHIPGLMALKNPEKRLHH